MAERAAIVTGGSRGIGLALAEVLADEGYGITVTARKPETLEQAANALRSRGAEVEQVAANLTDEESVSAVVAHHRETFGRLDASSTTPAWASAPRSTSTRASPSTCSSRRILPRVVDTDMSAFVNASIPAEEMLRTSDVAEALRFPLRLSPTCVIPEIVFQRPGEVI